jgi:hypothetical protein
MEKVSMLIPKAKHVLVAFSIVFPRAFKSVGEEKGVTNNNSCTQQIHSRYKKQIQAYKFTLTIKATTGLV